MKKILSLFILFTFVIVLFGGCSTPGNTKKELTRGVWEENTYMSEYANIKFTLPEGWTFASVEEIAEIMGVTAELMSEQGSEIKQELLEKTTIYDMMAQSVSAGTNIIIMYENLNLTAGGSKMTTEEYVEALKSQMANVDMYQTAEYEDIYEEKIGENTYQVLHVNVSAYDLSQYYYLRKIDKYMLGICMSLPIEEDITEIVKLIGNY